MSKLIRKIIKESYQEELMDISTRAAQEDALRQQLSSVQNTWNEVDLCLKQYKEAADLFVLAEVDELIQQVK